MIVYLFVAVVSCRFVLRLRGRARIVRRVGFLSIFAPSMLPRGYRSAHRVTARRARRLLVGRSGELCVWILYTQQSLIYAQHGSQAYLLCPSERAIRGSARTDLISCTWAFSQVICLRCWSIVCRTNRN